MAFEPEQQLENDAQKDKYLTFSCGQEQFSIDISFVTEIVGIQQITDIPDIPEYVKGIINLRGRIIPVIDVRILFGKHQRDYDDRTCIIVIIIGSTSIGLIVDRVHEVMTIPQEQIVPNPYDNIGQGNKFVRSIGKAGSDVKLILDCEKMLDIEKIKSLDIHQDQQGD